LVIARDSADDVFGSLPNRRAGRRPDVLGVETRGEFRDAARRLLAEHGYAGTTTRMIAEAVGVAPPTLHHHFGRKVTLVLAVWRVTIEEQHRYLREATEPQRTFAGKVEALLAAIHQSTCDQPEVATFIVSMREDARRSPELREILDDTHTADLVRDIVRFGVKSGELDPKDAATARGALSGMCMGLTMLAIDLTPPRMDAAHEGFLRLFHGDLVQRPRAKRRS
jgi:AcrR family transcriptional regulator